jgi:hypothetical protein
LESPRLTVDIDFVGDDVHPSELHRSIMHRLTSRTYFGHVEYIQVENVVAC